MKTSYDYAEQKSYSPLERYDILDYYCSDNIVDKVAPFFRNYPDIDIIPDVDTIFGAPWNGWHFFRTAICRNEVVIVKMLLRHFSAKLTKDVAKLQSAARLDANPEVKMHEAELLQKEKTQLLKEVLEDAIEYADAHNKKLSEKMLAVLAPYCTERAEDQETSDVADMRDLDEFDGDVRDNTSNEQRSSEELDVVGKHLIHH